MLLLVGSQVYSRAIEVLILILFLCNIIHWYVTSSKKISGYFSNIPKSNTSHEKIHIFSTCSNVKMDDSTGKSWKNWSKNVMVRYDWIKSFRDTVFHVETTFILLIQHFSHFSWVFDPSYLENFSSNHIEPYHFFDQLFQLFLAVLSIFTFEQL